MKQDEQDFSFKNFFIPLTNTKAICWIIIIGLVVYFNTLLAGFIWDDLSLITNNPFVHSIKNFFLFFTDANKTMYMLPERFYRPNMFAAFTIIYNFFGDNAFFYHSLQVFLHIVNTVLIYFLFNKFFKKNITIILALFFLVHPINAEVVNYISALQEVLFFFFGLLAFYIFQSGRPKTFKINILIGVLFFLSLLSKETGILFMLIAILYSFLFAKKYLKLSAILSVVSLSTYGCLRLIAAGHASIAPTANVLKINLFTSPGMFFYYLKTFFFPKTLWCNQMWLVNSASSGDFYLPLVADILFVLLIVALGFYVNKKNKKQLPTYIFFCVWFLIGIFFHLQLWFLDMTVADRWFYFPIVGLLGLFGVLFSSLTIKNKTLGLAIKLIIIFIITILAMRTMARNSNFQTNLSLLKHDAPIANNYPMYSMLFEEYFRQNDIQNAKVTLSNLTSLDSGNSMNLWYSGLIEEKLGNYPKAEEYYEKLLPTNSGLYGYMALSRVLISIEKDDKRAEKVLKEGIVKHQDSGYLWELLAVSQYDLGKKEEALSSIEKAIALSPTQEVYYVYRQILNDEPINW